jgi:hypothetical protein
MHLQSYVIPVCLYAIEAERATIKELIGTAFFVNGNGVFLTARHVLESAAVNASQKNLLVGLVLKDEGGKSAASVIAGVIQSEFAPEPYDIAIGQVNYQCETLLTLSPLGIEVWQEVATFGYPLHAVSGDPTALRLNIRCHKGYVQRLLQPGDVPIGPNPNGFELSFLLSRGLSGAPLFVHQQPKDIVIGVCVGSFRTELIEDEYLEVLENGASYKEVKLKIEEYGTAHDLRPLYDWRPILLNGLTLLEAST